MTLLKQMSGVLTGVQALSFDAQQTREVGASTGQLLTYYSTSALTLERPNHVAFALKGDFRDLSIWYDGQSLTLLDPRRNLYAQKSMTTTLDTLADILPTKLGIAMPLATFVVSDPYAFASKGLTSAYDAGTVTVRGTPCEHLAFRESDADWQLWVSKGASPLPMRMAITYLQIAGHPRVVLELSNWKLGAAVPASTFTFNKPSGAEPIKMVEH